MRKVKRLLCYLLVFIMIAGTMGTTAYATDVTEDAVQQVIAQLEAIDSLQTIQNKRYDYKVKYTHYDTSTTDPAIAEEHEKVRADYEAYVSEMFAARIAAQKAYDELTDAQKAQIDDALVAKLSNELPTVFKGGTYEVTPRNDEYAFEAVKLGTGGGYEVSNHMVSGQIPQTFILVDTANGETSWTPSGKYVYGESNYEVTYCCDVQTNLVTTTDYKRVNLEDSNYYGKESAKHIRAILQNAYPYLSVEEMKESLKQGGLDSTFVDSLTRADMIAAVQMAVWTYANANDGAQGGLGYFASVDIPKNTGIYFTPLHDYTNECWDWLPGKRQRSYDARAEYRVNNLAYYLCNLPGVEAEVDEKVITDIKVSRADLIPGTDDTYRVGMYVYLNGGGNAKDDLKITAMSYHENADGTITITGKSNVTVNDQSSYAMTVKAKYGDKIKVVVEGTQYLDKGVYFYEPEGGRDVSQSLVGVGSGRTKVRAEEIFELGKETDMGLRIYKTASDTGEPISDITFTIYNVALEDGETLSEVPTEAEIAKYAVEANKVGTIVTDETGYGFKGLDKGTYLVVEEHNKEKVEAPVEPFYITIPMAEPSEVEGVEVIYNDIVSVYPKNTPVEEPEEPPIIPPTPDEVSGDFTILKHDAHDENRVLKGAKFQVYRAATTADALENTETVVCEGKNYAVVPVTVNDVPLILTTGEDGIAKSPELDCGVYFLEEVEAPDGYNLLDEAIKVTVLSNEMVEKELVRIPNERGTILPETGGFGTTGIMTTGAIMMLLAVTLLVTKKRMINY